MKCMKLWLVNAPLPYIGQWIFRCPYNGTCIEMFVLFYHKCQIQITLESMNLGNIAYSTSYSLTWSKNRTLGLFMLEASANPNINIYKYWKGNIWNEGLDLSRIHQYLLHTNGKITTPKLHVKVFCYPIWQPTFILSISTQKSDAKVIAERQPKHLI